MSNLLTLRNALFACAIAWLCAGPAHAGESGPPVPDPQVLIDLVRDTVLAVDAGNKTGDYGKLFDMGAPAFQTANPPERLAQSFAPLRAHNLDLAPVEKMTPLTTGPPALDRNGLLRILGFFELADRQLVYDVLYDYDAAARRWRIAGISLTPRDLPKTPELMQPQ